ncbi:hypothetical protein [Streptomyces caatingaensis]|uniref:hypothetical protein n=1 Tax=Streptomyces caatingaensis TaxID=1678637 RepID=UPI00099B321A|nr:hypothetical protein [Streptomyces caatingaensis]
MHDRYSVKLEPPLSPPGFPVDLLTALADALNAVGTPVADALDELTPEAVGLAFNSTSPQERQGLLHRLGINLAAPRRASKSLCRDILARLRREARQHACSCAAQGLTPRVLEDVVRASLPGDAAAVDPVTRWGAALVKVTVFSWCHASVQDAAIYLWAAEQDWLGLGSGVKELEAVRVAADAVAAAAAEPTPGLDDVQDRRPETLQPASSPDADRPDAARSSSPEDEVGRAYEAVKEALTTARTAAGNVVDALDDGRPPAGEDLTRISALPPAFAQAVEALAAVGRTDVPYRLEDIGRAAAAHGAERDRDRAARRALQTLLTIRSPADSAAATAVTAAHELAGLLLDTSVWDEEERVRASALAALVETVQLASQADAQPRIAALQLKVVQVLPECTEAALWYRELSLPEPEAGTVEVDRTPKLEHTVPTGEPPTAPAAAPATVAPVPVAEALEEADPHDVEAPAGTADGASTAASSQEDEVPDPAPGPPPLPVALPGEEFIPSGAATKEPAVEAPGPVPEVVVPSAPVPTTVETELARLIAEGRFGLAAHVSGAARRPEAESAALRLAAAAAVLRPGAADGARIVGEALLQWGALDARDAEGTELLLLPALVRAALVTGEHVTGAQLKALAPRLPESLAGVAIAVADRALSNALSLAPPLAVIADVSESEARLREITEQCRAMLKPPRLRFNRATRMAKRWLAEDGVLGGLLRNIADGRPGADAGARAMVERLGRLSEIQSEIDRVDREFRGSSGTPLQGSGRQDLVHLVERVVDCVKTWLDVTGTLARGKAADEWAVQEIAAMRQEVLDLQSGVFAELESAMGRSGLLSVAAATAARDSLVAVFQELGHGAAARRSAAEPDAHQLVDAELLKIPVAQDGRPPLADLLAAVNRTWDEALEIQVGQDAFGAAYHILDLADQGRLPDSRGFRFDAAVRTRVEESEARRRLELGRRHEELVAELRRAQADGALSDDQDVRLQELLADARPTAEDGASRELSRVRRILDEVAELLPRYREEAADRLRARLAALPDVTDDDRAQVLRNLETGGFATAADLVYFLELGEPVPEIESDESHLGHFYPAVPQGLADGITGELIRMVREAQKHPVLPALDFTRLSADEASKAAHAMSLWKDVADTAPKERQSTNVRTMLMESL